MILTYVLAGITILSFLAAVILAVERWARARMRHEETSEHRRAVDLLNQQITQLSLSIKHETDREVLRLRLDNMDSEIKRLHDKASREYGKMQKSIGDMELNQRGFMSKASAQLDELYRMRGGRRAADHSEEGGA